MTTAPVFPPAAVLLGTWINNAMVVLGLDVGHPAGLFEFAAKTGPATSEALALALARARGGVVHLATTTQTGIDEADHGLTVLPTRRPCEPVVLALAQNALRRSADERHRRPDANRSASPRRGWRGYGSVLVLVVCVALYDQTSAGASRTCAAIHYVVTAAAADHGPFSELGAAVSELTEIAGVPFVYDGVAPSVGIAAPEAMRTSLVVEWARGTGRYAPGFPLQWAGHASVKPRLGHGVAAEARISLNADAALARGMGADSWGAVLRHELGHVLGLNHSDTPGDVMYPEVYSSGRWSAHELDALEQIGRQMGCMVSGRP